MSALPQKANPEVADVVAALERARGRDDGALRDAVEIAPELIAFVIPLIEKAADRVYLLPKQLNLMFWGLHALAAAGCKELCQPLLRLLRRCDEDELNELLGDTITESLKKVVVAVFDGDAAVLVEACADRNMDSYARWSLIVALARLTFDGAVPRELTLSFFDRFEREPLADFLDPAWEGWAEAIALLGLEEMRERLQGAYLAGRFDETISGRDHYERQLTLAANLKPGDPSLFVQERVYRFEDPVKELSWIKTDQELRAAGTKNDVDLDDPAGPIALDRLEREWLDGFVRSRHVPADTLAPANLEQIDGFFCALIAGPPGATFDEYAAAIWSEESASDVEPDYDSPEQAEFVGNLLKRHWNTISLRLNADRPHDLVLPDRAYELQGRYWAGGFLRGVALRAAEWGTRQEDEDVSAFLSGVLALGVDAISFPNQAVKRHQRPTVISALPKAVLLMYCLWRGRSYPYGRQPDIGARQDFGRKVGRNEPCPCGSGQKYKRCCGAPDKRVVN